MSMSASSFTNFTLALLLHQVPSAAAALAADLEAEAPEGEKEEAMPAKAEAHHQKVVTLLGKCGIAGTNAKNAFSRRRVFATWRTWLCSTGDVPRLAKHVAGHRLAPTFLAPLES
jgi:hypothetical protein